jgi:hypothetical protein
MRKISCQQGIWERLYTANARNERSSVIEKLMIGKFSGINMWQTRSVRWIGYFRAACNEKLQTRFYFMRVLSLTSGLSHWLPVGLTAIDILRPKDLEQTDWSKYIASIWPSQELKGNSIKLVCGILEFGDSWEEQLKSHWKRLSTDQTRTHQRDDIVFIVFQCFHPSAHILASKALINPRWRTIAFCDPFAQWVRQFVIGEAAKQRRVKKMPRNLDVRPVLIQMASSVAQSIESHWDSVNSQSIAIRYCVSDQFVFLRYNDSRTFHEWIKVFSFFRQPLARLPWRTSFQSHWLCAAESKEEENEI